MVSVDGSKKASLRTNLIMFFISLLVSVLLLELAARQLMPAPLPWLYPQIRYQSDEVTIFSLKPEQLAYTADKQAIINARGIRGPVYNYKKDRGVTRIVFLGDSVVFGFGVDMNDVVTSKVEQLLQSKGEEVEVINTGVPSFNTEQEIAFLRNEGVRYSPDLVILGFYWNDVSDKSDVKVSRSGWLIERDSDESRLGFINKFWLSESGYAVRNIIKRSRLVYSLMQGYKALVSGDSGQLNAGLRADILGGKNSKYLAGRWADIEKAMQEFRRLSNQHDFSPMVVVFPIPPALAEPFPDNKFVETIRGISDRAGIRFLDLEPEFRKAYKGHESLFIPYDSDHPNATGHAVAARAIANFIDSARMTGSD